MSRPALAVFTGVESMARSGRALRLGLPMEGLQRWTKPGSMKILDHAVAAQPKIIVDDS